MTLSRSALNAALYGSAYRHDSGNGQWPIDPSTAIVCLELALNGPATCNSSASAIPANRNR